MDQVALLFDSIGGLQGIKQLVKDRVKEDIHLEFKAKKDRSTSELGDSDAWQFSRALSGFANSDGGILVWGVETTRQNGLTCSSLFQLSKSSKQDSRSHC